MDRVKIKKCPYNIILSNRIFTFKRILKSKGLDHCDDIEPIDISFFYLKYNTNGDVYFHLNILMEILDKKCFHKIFERESTFFSDSDYLDEGEEIEFGNDDTQDGLTRVKRIRSTNNYDSSNIYLDVLVKYFEENYAGSLLDSSLVFDYIKQKYFINSSEFITFLKINEKYLYDSERIFNLLKSIVPEKLSLGGQDELISIFRKFENSTKTFSIFDLLQIFRLLDRPTETWINSFLKDLMRVEKMEIFTLFIDYGDYLANLQLLGTANKICKLIHSRCTFNDELLKVPILRLSLDCSIKDTFNDPLYQLTLKQLKRVHKVKKINEGTNEKYAIKLNSFMKTLVPNDFKYKKSDNLRAISKKSFEDVKRDEKFMEYYNKIYSENLLFLEISSREILGYSDLYANIKSQTV